MAEGNPIFQRTVENRRQAQPSALRYQANATGGDIRPRQRGCGSYTGAVNQVDEANAVRAQDTHLGLGRFGNQQLLKLVANFVTPFGEAGTGNDHQAHVLLRALVEHPGDMFRRQCINNAIDVTWNGGQVGVARQLTYAGSRRIDWVDGTLIPLAQKGGDDLPAEAFRISRCTNDRDGTGLEKARNLGWLHALSKRGGMHSVQRCHDFLLNPCCLPTAALRPLRNGKVPACSLQSNRRTQRLPRLLWGETKETACRHLCPPPGRRCRRPRRWPGTHRRCPTDQACHGPPPLCP